MSTGKVNPSKGSRGTTEPPLGFPPKGHQSLGVVRMIRQPGLHNKEDIQANNFPLSSSELDVFHGFFQGCCQGLFAPLTSSVLKGSGSRQRCKCPECHQPCLEIPGRTTASGFGLCSCQVSLPPLKEDDSTECRRFKQQGRKKKEEQNLTSITSDQALACKHISNMLVGRESLTRILGMLFHPFCPNMSSPLPGFLPQTILMLRAHFHPQRIPLLPQHS